MAGDKGKEYHADGNRLFRTGVTDAHLLRACQCTEYHQLSAERYDEDHLYPLSLHPTTTGYYSNGGDYSYSHRIVQVPPQHEGEVHQCADCQDAGGYSFSVL